MTAAVETPVAPSDAPLRQRLVTVAGVLLDDPQDHLDPGADVASVLDTVVGAVLADPTPARVWLLLVGLSGALPDDAQVRRAIRALELRDATDALLWLLDTTLVAAVEAGTADRPLDLVVDGVVVDASHAATHDLHTGIQRVLRSTVPIWARTHEVHLVALTPGGHALRRLRPEEEDRVLRWGASDGRTRDPAAPAVGGPESDVLVVPWRSTVVAIEVPARDMCARYATLAQWSGNRLVVVGHDCIPVVSALSVPLEEPNRFVHYLTMIKFTQVVAGVSISATEEFRGFASMLAAQGLPGPRVVECALAVDDGGVPAGTPAVTGADGPLVVGVGSFEPRKNHLAVLYAAEVLWREGLHFRLRLIGGSSWGHDVVRGVARLARRGRAVEVRSAVSDAELERSYREARFTVFVSRHEGFGLPLAESIGRGVPVLTGDFGSQREIAAAGGALLVDPRDDDAIVDGMRRLLTDDALVDDLRRQIAARPRRTWTDYADELWTTFGLPGTEPVRAEPVGTEPVGGAS